MDGDYITKHLANEDFALFVTVILTNRMIDNETINIFHLLYLELWVGFEVFGILSPHEPSVAPQYHHEQHRHNHKTHYQTCHQLLVAG